MSTPFKPVLATSFADNFGGTVILPHLPNTELLSQDEDPAIVSKVFVLRR